MLLWAYGEYFALNSCTCACLACLPCLPVTSYLLVAFRWLMLRPFLWACDGPRKNRIVLLCFGRRATAPYPPPAALVNFFFFSACLFLFLFLFSLQSLVPTITCTSSNVLNTVLQAFAQVSSQAASQTNASADKMGYVGRYLVPRFCFLEMLRFGAWSF